MLECCFKGYTCIDEYVTDGQQKAEDKCEQWHKEGFLVYVSHKIGDNKWVAKKVIRSTEES